MNKIEAFEQLLQQVDEDKRAPLIEKLRVADGEERLKILEEAGVRVPEDWKSAFRKGSNFEVSDDDLDIAAGGCFTCCASYCCRNQSDCCD